MIKSNIKKSILTFPKGRDNIYKMNLSEKIYFTISILFTISLAYLYVFLLKKYIRNYIKRINENLLPLFDLVFKFFRFMVYYILPLMALFLLITKWVS